MKHLCLVTFLLAGLCAGAQAQSMGDLLNRAKGLVDAAGERPGSPPAGLPTPGGALATSAASAGPSLPDNIERLVEDTVSACRAFLLQPGETEPEFTKRMLDNRVNSQVMKERKAQYESLKTKAIAADPRVSTFTGRVFETANVKAKLEECDARFPKVIATLSPPTLRIVNATGQDICNIYLRGSGSGTSNGNSDNVPKNLVIKAGSSYSLELIEALQTKKKFSATNCDRTQRLFAVKDLDMSANTELVLGTGRPAPADGFRQLVIAPEPKACQKLEMTSTGSNCDVIKDAGQRNTCLARDPRKTRSLGTTQECNDLFF